jgi:hypothetical protein
MPLHSHHTHRRSSLNSKWAVSEHNAGNVLMKDRPGTRSSTDDTRPDSAGGPEEETTIVEPDQGNGEDLQ